MTSKEFFTEATFHEDPIADPKSVWTKRETILSTDQTFEMALKWTSDSEEKPRKAKRIMNGPASGPAWSSI